MIGRVFGNLTVLSSAGRTQNRKKNVAKWLCECSCGAHRQVTGSDLVAGRIDACFFRRSEDEADEYVAYHAMRARCLNKRNKEYKNYGGRGITICDRWLDGAKCKNGFQCFIDDMGRKPSRSHSIERKDTNGHYDPNNCKWATKFEQIRNRRNTRKISISGREISIAEAAENAGLKYRTVIDRIDKYGMSVDMALSHAAPGYSRLLRRHTPVYAKDKR